VQEKALKNVLKIMLAIIAVQKTYKYGYGMPNHKYTISGFPTHITLDSRTNTNGEIMCEQVKCLDIAARNASYKETIPNDILDEAIDLICSFVE